MLKINLICMGDIKEKYLREAIGEYQKRISRFANLNIVELKENNPTSSSISDINLALKKDGVEISKHLKGYAVCMDKDGTQFSSEEFAKFIEKTSLTNGEISFIIGASNGIDEDLKTKCNKKISFSKMTFPHQLMRVIFLEQLYRAFTILNNIAYHK